MAKTSRSFKSRADQKKAAQYLQAFPWMSWSWVAETSADILARRPLTSAAGAVRKALALRKALSDACLVEAQKQDQDKAAARENPFLPAEVREKT